MRNIESPNSLESVPAEHRDVVTAAVSSAFGLTDLSAVHAMTGGASGALIYRVAVENRDYLLRLETRRHPFRNPHQYVCMQAASDAGIAPALRYLDPAAGVAIMDCVSRHPLAAYPGGPVALTRELGRLAARLQATSLFPEFRDYLVIVERLLGMVRGSSLFAPGLLDAHAAGFDRIRQAYAWDPSAHVSAHNDPNPQNILFDGERLWLIDWETAYRNDPLTDVAILADNFAATPELEDALLVAWLGRPPDRALRARFQLMRQITRLYYAGLLLSLVAAAPRSAPDDDLTAPTPEQFRAAIGDRTIAPGSPEMMHTLGKMSLARFLDGLSAPGFNEALVIAGHG